jgi:ribosome recycling factor
VPIPPMTEERRRKVVKHLNEVLEEHRTATCNGTSLADMQREMHQ